VGGGRVALVAWRGVAWTAVVPVPCRWAGLGWQLSRLQKAYTRAKVEISEKDDAIKKLSRRAQATDEANAKLKVPSLAQLIGHCRGLT
jgi:hypothetical protein